MGSLKMANTDTYPKYVYGNIDISVITNGEARLPNTKINKLPVGFVKLTAKSLDNAVEIRTIVQPGMPEQGFNILIDGRPKVGAFYQGSKLASTGPGNLTAPSVQPFPLNGLMAEGMGRIFIAVACSPLTEMQWDWAIDVFD